MVSKHVHSLWAPATDAQSDWGLGFVRVTSGPWFWCPSRTIGLISMYALGHCLVGRSSNNIRQDYEEILAHYHSKYYYDILFSWRHASNQGSLCIRLQNSPTALNPMFNCGNCVVRVEDLSLSSPNMSNIHVPKQFKSSIIRPKHRTELIFTLQKKKKKTQSGWNDGPEALHDGESSQLCALKHQLQKRPGQQQSLGRCTCLLDDISDYFPL